ncbi:MAG: hypothetical protein JO256_01490 [Alphaproteobacteria bacterium]|nr:hypothetical protein [Alphaproteobacteria bacterium]
MSQTLTIPSTLSPGFTWARKLSRVMVAFFAIALLLNLTEAISAPLFAIFRTTPSGVGLGIGLTERVIIGFGSLTPWQAIGAVIGVELFVLPRMLSMYHILRLFLCFARGEVFAARPIAHLRVAGWWLTATFFASIAAVWLMSAWGALSTQGDAGHFRFPGAVIGLALIFRSTLFTGFPVIIAAYVMEEARRIAADHAEII